MRRFCKIVLVFMFVNIVTVLCPMWATGNPSELPQFSIQPSAITVWEGETFTLNFTIGNLDAGFEMYGFSTRPIFVYDLSNYNESVLKLELVDEGPFLRQFPTPPYTSESCTLFSPFFAEERPDGSFYPPYVAVFLLPVIDPSVSNPVFPEGNGTLETWTFKAKAQGTTIVAFEGLLGGNASTQTVVSYELNATVEVKHQNGDLNADRLVDIRDISLASRAFGSVPGYPNWNAAADMNQNSMIDIRDIALIAKNFGKTFS